MDSAVELIRNDLFNRRLLVISCGKDGKEFCDRIHQESNVVYIYIFCGDLAKHSIWAKNYMKIQGVFTDEEDLKDSILT